MMSLYDELESIELIDHGVFAKNIRLEKIFLISLASEVKSQTGEYRMVSSYHVRYLHLDKRAVA